MIGRLGEYITFGFDFPGSDKGDDAETLAGIKNCENLRPLLKLFKTTVSVSTQQCPQEEDLFQTTRKLHDTINAFVGTTIPTKKSENNEEKPTERSKTTLKTL
ncbi:hypothetical protein Y032_0580g263 [Ancylostoma ceylanicum]|uniref:Uncharacterized protein n=1 Tax=Ancylostoma ceylanicum TaxID=53326 RepID=A0A016WPH5_9BILA|nr:hypothetical protein Y032_0580g263 [Ancylostoma ceylanicum]